MDFFGVHLTFDPADQTIQVVRKVTIFEIFSILGILIAVASLIVSLLNARGQSRTTSAEFSFKLWERFRSEEIQSGFLEIEWGGFNYPYPTISRFESPEQEKRIDRLLYFLDDVAGLAKRGVISKADITRWEYIGARVFQATGVNNYLDFLQKWYAENNVSTGPHLSARSYFVSEGRARGQRWIARHSSLTPPPRPQT
jgi:hypothetical protein